MCLNRACLRNPSRGVRLGRQHGFLAPVAPAAALCRPLLRQLSLKLLAVSSPTSSNLCSDSPPTRCPNLPAKRRLLLSSSPSSTPTPASCGRGRVHLRRLTSPPSSASLQRRPLLLVRCRRPPHGAPLSWPDPLAAAGPAPLPPGFPALSPSPPLSAVQSAVAMAPLGRPCASSSLPWMATELHCHGSHVIYLAPAVAPVLVRKRASAPPHLVSRREVLQPLRVVPLFFFLGYFTTDTAGGILGVTSSMGGWLLEGEAPAHSINKESLVTLSRIYLSQV